MRPELIDDIVEIMREIHVESRTYGQLPWDEAQLRTRLIQLVALPQGYVDYVEGKGVMLGLLHEHWTGVMTVGSVLLWYVKPEFRGGSLGIRLLDRWHRFCDDSEVVFTYAGDSAGLESSSSLSILGRKGYTHSATVMQRRHDNATSD